MAKDKGGEGDSSVAGLTFEAALEELEEIVERLEAGSVDLEESVDLYDRGVKLRAHCQKKLDAARERVEKVAGGKLESMNPDNGNSDNDGNAGIFEEDDAPPF